ncbi:MAG: formylmethanofuran dehydrogenase subunit E family protein [Thermoguttaceae bacterium]|nr:formylmethanofuran dehydrogenase subunit E family protein [Thermoguttaceae bacterium]
MFLKHRIGLVILLVVGSLWTLARSVDRQAQGMFTEDRASMAVLPQPHYEPKPEDPPWLPVLVQFHGHLGPWVVLGFRLGEAARKAVDAAGYFDVEVYCLGPFEKPPAACFLDGVQLATGATWGKRNIAWELAEIPAVKLTHLPTGRKAVVTVRREVVDLIAKTANQSAPQSGRPHGAQPVDKKLDDLARQIARMKPEELFTLELATP